MLRRNKTVHLPKSIWTTKKPLAPGRFWWSNEAAGPPTLVYVEKQHLGFYVVGVGWLPYQSGQWAGPCGETEPGSKN